MAQQEKKSLVKELIDLGKQKGSLTNQDILDALGEGDFDPEKLDLYFESRAGKLLVYTDGKKTSYTEEEASAILSEDEVTIIADMKQGSEAATAWGCDLSYDYVKINADYRS